MPASCSLSPGGKAALDRLGKFAEGMVTLEKRTLLEVSRRYKEQILPAAAAAKGVTLGRPLSGMPGSRSRLGTGYDPVSGEDPIVVRHKARGQWQLIDGPTKPHVILSKKLGTRRLRADLASRAQITFPAGRRGAVSVGGLRLAYVRHPGTPGKGILLTARQKLAQDFAEIMVRAHRDALRQTLRG